MTNEPTQTPVSRFAKALDAFRQTSLEYAHDPESIGNQMIVAKAFESLVESTLILLATRVEAENQTAPQRPREMLDKAQDMGMIADAGVWAEALDYCSKLRKSDKPDAIQEALDFSQTYFTDAVDELADQQESRTRE